MYVNNLKSINSMVVLLFQLTASIRDIITDRERHGMMAVV